MTNQFAYNKSIIYKIQHIEKPELIYIGSTTNFKMRKCQHKANCLNETSAKYNYPLYQSIRTNDGWYSFSMIQIKEFPCNTKRELEAEEFKLIHELKATLNTHKYTTEQKPIRMKEYREANKETIKIKDKIYRELHPEIKKKYEEEHKEEIKDKNKNYRLENEVKIKEFKSKKYDCPCGGKYCHSEKARHYKTQKHLKYIKENPDVITTV